MVATSSNRGFSVPTVGGDANLWGGYLNTTIAELDTSLGATLTLNSSTSLNVTLASSQAQISRMVIQGLVADNTMASNFTLTFPSANYALGNYTVWNNTLGPGGVICVATGPGGGSQCSVNAGSMRLVNVDGTNAQFADSQPTTALVPTFINKFRNPGMDIFQRGGTITPGAGAYTLDGWIVKATTGSPSVTQVYNSHLSGNAMRITGNNAAMTVLDVLQNIESYVAVQLLGTNPASVSPITVRFDIYNNSGGAFTPQIYAGYANAQDNFSAVTSDLSPQNLQPCPNGALTTVAYTFTPSANLANGYQICLRLGAALNGLGGTVDISHCDVRAAPGVAPGLNSSPPTVELRPIYSELQVCQRYLFIASSGWFYNTFYAGDIGEFQTAIAHFPVSMRIKPTATGLIYTKTNCGNPNTAVPGSTAYGWGFLTTNTSGLPNVQIIVTLTAGTFSAEL